MPRCLGGEHHGGSLLPKSLKFTSVDRIVKRPISTENAISALLNNLDKNKSAPQLEDGSPTPLTVTH